MSDDWRAEFRIGLANLVDQAVVSGAKQTDVFKVAIEEIESLGTSNERDPDPADDMSENLSKSRQMTGRRRVAK